MLRASLKQNCMHDKSQFKGSEFHDEHQVMNERAMLTACYFFCKELFYQCESAELSPVFYL